MEEKTIINPTNEKGFMYLDKYGILHMTADKPQNVVSLECTFRNSGGYPVDNAGDPVIVYGPDECYTGGENRTNGRKKNTKQEFPALAKIYEKLAK